LNRTALLWYDETGKARSIEDGVEVFGWINKRIRSRKSIRRVTEKNIARKH
jgi:hypothetical protein